jgi:general secretion pathway protein D
MSSEMEEPDKLATGRSGVRWAALLALTVTLAGCATTGIMRNGRRAEERQDYDRAVVEYTRALQLNPDNADARTSLQRAKLRASQDHLARARRLAAVGRLDDAVIEYQLAAEMNPTSGEIADQLRETQNLLRAKVATNRDGKTELEALVDRMRDQPAPGLELPVTAPLPDSLTFRNASSQDVITALSRMANVNVIFDPAYRSTLISIDLRNQSFDQALRSITSSTQTFFRVTAPQTITVIPDTPAKRREYEEEVVRTFFLSNADLKETMDLLRIVIDARAIGSTSATNALTIHDTPERIAVAARLIDVIDKARPEVLIDVELLEVSRSKLAEYGLQFASPVSQGTPTGINGVADANRPNLSVTDLRNLTESQVLLTALPGLYYRLLKTDTSTRVLANPQLRTQVGLAAQAQFGDEVPVPVTTFAPFATGGVAQQPITSYNYRNIGVNIDITPRTHLDNDVTLTLKLKVDSISGTGYGGLPTFGNRQITTQIRLKDGETNMLAGLIRDDERRVRDGIPGMSDLPGVGHLFGRSRNERAQTDIILMLTPHIVRVLDLTEEDLRAFLMGRSGDGAIVGVGATDLPLPAPATPLPSGIEDDPVPVQPIVPPGQQKPPAPQAPPGPPPTPPTLR